MGRGRGQAGGSCGVHSSVVDAVRCAIEVQNGMVERNAGLPPERRIEFRVGIHLGDVVEESDGDLMGDGVNIAARLEGIAQPGAICLSEDAYRQVSGRLDRRSPISARRSSRTSNGRSASTRCKSASRPGQACDVGWARRAKKALLAGSARRWHRSLAHGPRGRSMVGPRSEPACSRRNEVASASRFERNDAC